MDINIFSFLEIDVRRDYATIFNRRSFTAKSKQIQIAISSVADRILFIRIAEELRKNKIQFESPVPEPKVGGYIMKITE